MFDVGFWELAIIGVVALVIVGPERLPGLARTAGLWIGKARRMVSDVKRDIDRELKASEMAEIKKDIDQASKEVQNVADNIKEESGVDDIQSSLKETFKEASPVDENTKSELNKGLDEIDEVAKQVSEELGEAKEIADQQAEAAAGMSGNPETSKSAKV
jgi:sec-independent protein translocase protein TatB